MDILYASVCLFFLILLLLYLKDKKKYLKERENNTNLGDPYDDFMVYRTYFFIFVLILAILYFIFR